MNEVPPKFLNSPVVARALKIKQLMDQEAAQAETQPEHNKSRKAWVVRHQGQISLSDEDLQRLWKQDHEYNPLDRWKDWNQWDQWDSWDKVNNSGKY